MRKASDLLPGALRDLTDPKEPPAPEANTGDPGASDGLSELRLSRIGIPGMFRTRTFDGFRAETPDQQDALRTCREFAAHVGDRPESLLLLGNAGTGKTHLACCIAMSAAAELGTLFRESTCEAIERVLYTTVDGALERVKASWSKGKEQEVRDTLRHPRLLVLDEIGVQSGSEFERNLLFSVMDYRYTRQLPTVLVSNLDLDGVREILGARVIDRLREHGAEVRVFDWESNRG